MITTTFAGRNPFDYTPPQKKPERAMKTKPTIKKPLTNDIQTLDDIKIDDDVPLPPLPSLGDKVRRATLAALLDKLQPKQSAELPFQMHSMLKKVMAHHHKTQSLRFTHRADKAKKTLRVWRVS